MTTYLTYPIWEMDYYLPGGPSVVNEFTVVGEVSTRQIKYSDEPTEHSFEFDYVQTSAAERQAARDLFNAARGRLNLFWIRSRIVMGKVKVAAAASSTTLQLYNNSLSDQLYNVVRHIYLPRIDQRVKIDTFVTVDDDQTLQLTIDPGLSANVIVDDLVEWLYLCRLTSDEWEIRMRPDLGLDVSSVRVSAREMQRETP